MKRNNFNRPGTAAMNSRNANSQEPRLFSAQNKTLIPLFPLNKDSTMSKRLFFLNSNLKDVNP